MAAQARTLRCPLCCEAFVVHSEEECQAHIASCTAFRAEYGASAARAGLVNGFEDAVAAAARQTEPPERAGALSLADACAQYADALAPLVPMAMIDHQDRTLAEATELVTHLASALAQSAAESKGSDLGFGIEELVTVTIGPLLESLDESRGKAVLANITPALAAVELAAAAEARSDAIGELLQRSLEARMASRIRDEPSLGKVMRIVGLVKAAQHNGKVGRLLDRKGGEGRVGVQLDDGQLLSVRPENLEAVP